MNKAQTQAQLMVENTDLIQSFLDKPSERRKKRRKEREKWEEGKEKGRRKKNRKLGK